LAGREDLEAQPRYWPSLAAFAKEIRRAMA
jgi:hypothetical protein